ncbi:MAG: NPCBM/NEW2 domain-containing protein [Pirellulales bacterium]
MTAPRLFPALGFAASIVVSLGTWICAGASSTAADRPPPLTVLRADGTRVFGKQLTTTPADPKTPLPDWKLDDQPLFDAPQPPRWIRDRGVSLAAAPPPAFIETITGDRLPGEVVGFDDGRTRPFDPQPPHLLVRPVSPLSPPQPVADPVVRVVLRHVRRVVWQRRDVESWQPGTVFFRDGRAVPFRAVRWSGQSLNLLLADGPKSASFSEVAEVHLPFGDYWEAFWDELAVLCPRGEGRLWQFEASDGLLATSSRERSRLHHPGGPQDATRWIHGLQPAWALDALWIPHQSVAIVRSFAVHETPLSRVAIAAQRQQGWLTEQGAPPRVNRNVQRGSLRGGDGEYGWGFGVQAISRLEFDAPPAARAFRSRVGLDRMAGKGGCVRARVFIGEGKTPAFESGFLVGADQVVETGVVPLPAGQTQPTRLRLEIDAAHDGRPAGADPFDIRDLADWFDPLLEFDPNLAKQEIVRRTLLPGPALQGWTWKPTASAPESARSATNLWDELASSPGRYVVVESLAEGTMVWTREAKLEPHDRWLVVAASLIAQVEGPPRIEVWVDDELAGEQTLAVRNGGQRDPPPLLVALQPYGARTVKLELRLAAGKTPTPVSWRTVRLSAQTPNLFQALEDEADWTEGGEANTQPAWDGEERFSGRRSVRLAPEAVEELRFSTPAAVRESPAWGEYRYARLAFRKKMGGQVSVEFLPTEPRERPLRLDGGTGTPAFGEAVRFYQAPLPDQWLPIPIDLFANLGRFDARGIRLAGLSGGPAYFDAIYLARTQGDLELIPFVAGPFRPTSKAMEDAVKSISARVAPSLVSFTSAQGRPALGVLVSPNGEVLTTGRALGEPNRTFMATLADGKTTAAKSKGLFRNADLGLLQLEGAGPWPTVEVFPSPNLPAELVYAHVSRREAATNSPMDGNSALDVRPTLILRTTRATLWTDADATRYEHSAAPLVDAYGRVVGFASRRHGAGVLSTRVVEWPAAAARLRAGEVWGEWPSTLAVRSP